MMDVSPISLKFFAAACCFGIVIGVMGCATNNWSQPMFKNRQMQNDSGTEAGSSSIAESGAVDEDDHGKVIKAPKSFWKQGFGEMSGIDPRSREIERSLGY